MSSGPQWAADQDRMDSDKERFQQIMVGLAVVGSLSQHQLIHKFDNLSYSLKTLKDIRLSRSETKAFEEIENFLKEIGV